MAACQRGRKFRELSLFPRSPSNMQLFQTRQVTCLIIGSVTRDARPEEFLELMVVTKRPYMDVIRIQGPRWPFANVAEVPKI